MLFYSLSINLERRHRYNTFCFRSFLIFINIDFNDRNFFIKFCRQLFYLWINFFTWPTPLSCEHYECRFIAWNDFFKLFKSFNLLNSTKFLRILLYIRLFNFFLLRYILLVNYAIITNIIFTKRAIHEYILSFKIL